MDPQKRKNIILGSIAAVLLILAALTIMRGPSEPELNPEAVSANDKLSEELAQNQPPPTKPESKPRVPEERGAGKAPVDGG